MTMHTITIEVYDGNGGWREWRTRRMSNEHNAAEWIARVDARIDENYGNLWPRRILHNGQSVTELELFQRMVEVE